VRRDLGERPFGGAHEPGAEQQVLGRIAGDGEFREEDEIAALRARVLEPSDDQVAVAVQVADDGVDLCERESQVFTPLSRKPSLPRWRS
jgi:hypothetical protein